MNIGLNDIYFPIIQNILRGEIYSLAEEFITTIEEYNYSTIMNILSKMSKGSLISELVDLSNKQV